MTVDVTAIQSLPELLAVCRAVDAAAAEQLEELADSFAMSNNTDTAETLRELAAWKQAQADDSPADAAVGEVEWWVVEPGDPAAVHYMMRPWHAVGIALEAEERAQELLDRIAVEGPSREVRAAAERLLETRGERIAHLRAWRERLPEPEDGWDEDSDPPFFDQ